MSPHPQLYLPSRPYITAPDGWDTAWNAAKQNATTNPIRLNIIGDSIAAGSASASFSTSFAEKVIQSLQAQYGIYADHYHAWINDNDASIPGAPWHDNQTCTRVAGQTWTSTTVSANTGANPIQTFTTPYACTAMDFLWFSAGGDSGTFKWAVDGGAQTQLTNPGDNTVHRVQLTSLATTTHTFQWGWQSGANACRAIGAVAYKPGATTGLAAGRLQASSNRINDINDGWLRNTQGVTGVPTGPHLAIVQLYTNDVNTSEALATMQSRLYQVDRALQGGTPGGCSLLYVLTSYPDNTYDDVNTSYANKSTAWQYQDALIAQARRSNAALINVQGKWGCTPFAKGFLPTNDLHPTTAGHTDIANAILPLL